MCPREDFHLGDFLIQGFYLGAPQMFLFMSSFWAHSFSPSAAVWASCGVFNSRGRGLGPHFFSFYSSVFGQVPCPLLCLVSLILQYFLIHIFHKINFPLSAKLRSIFWLCEPGRSLRILKHIITLNKLPTCFILMFYCIYFFVIEHTFCFQSPNWLLNKEDIF